jgi:hypothetical protein
LIVAEVCNVAWKRLRAGEITEEHATRAIIQIEQSRRPTFGDADFPEDRQDIGRAISEERLDGVHAGPVDLQ